MKTTQNLAAALIALAAVASPVHSNAALVFEITRVSDSQAVITGSGSLDAPFTGNKIGFADSTSIGDPGIDALSGTMTLGGVAAKYAYASQNLGHFSLEFADGASFAGAILTGLLNITLDVETWAPVGTTGNLYNQVPGGFLGTELLGTYSIVGPTVGEVPEPGTVALLSLGLVAVAAARKRKKG
jgi:PEP-CTERM motif